MRAGKKTEAETGKTRPCIVYVKNLKESETTELINSSSSAYTSKQSKIVRNATVKVPNKRTFTEKEREREGEREREVRETRTTRRAASIANVDLLPKRQTPVVIIGKSPTSAAAVRGRNIKGNVPKAVATSQLQLQQQQQLRPLSKRRNTEYPVARGTAAATTTPCTPVTLTKRRNTTRLVESEPPKTKMYKQSKLSSSPPSTIAASRSRRSIKPNPKYASEDMVTPKYVSSLANESFSKRGSRQFFTDDDDDDDEDLQDLIEEDNDDELNDAAFIPQMHKSDDDDDMSENEYEEQLRREKVPPKRGRGRPPKNPQAIAAAAAAQAARSAAASSSASSTQFAVRGMTQSGRGGVTNLQQLRRTMAVNSNLARSNMPARVVTVGNKRKLEDHNDTPIARKRMATEGAGGGIGRAPPVINGSTSVAKTSAIGLNKTKVIMGNSNNNNSGGGGVRLIQAPNAKQQQASNFKMNTPTTTTTRVGNIIRQAPTKMQKTMGSGAGGGGGGGAASAKMKAVNDDVPTFTIVNINDIINQDDVLISRSSTINNNNSKKLSPAARNNNNNNNNNNNSNSRNNQSSSSASTLNNSTSSNNLSLSSSIKRLKSTPTITTTVSTMKVSSSSVVGKQNPLLEAKPRPRILNAEMGKKAPMMKPLMSMSKELCPMTDGPDTEDEDLSNDLDDDITISPQSAAAAQPPSNTQNRVVRRVQTAKWLPATRRNILSTPTSVNASNNQRQQLQQKPKLQQQQQQQLSSDRKLTKLLGESSDDDVVFKKPASPSTSATHPQRRSKENDDAAAAKVGGKDPLEGASKPSKPAKCFPPETITYCEEDGRLVKKITCYETWHVISTPKESTNKPRQQRTCLELPLVKLANVASRIKMPSTKWTSKITLFKVSPSLMQRQTMTIFTGDLKTYNIPEEERHKYQPSCVLFRRSVLDRTQCRVPFDRAIIFKNKCFYVNIEGKHVNLLGAPEVVNTVKDVEILIDIADSMELSSEFVEMVTSK